MAVNLPMMSLTELAILIGIVVGSVIAIVALVLHQTRPPID